MAGDPRGYNEVGQDWVKIKGRDGKSPQRYNMGQFKKILTKPKMTKSSLNHLCENCGLEGLYCVQTLINQSTAIFFSARFLVDPEFNDAFLEP